MSKLELAKLTTEDNLPTLAKKDELVKFLNQSPPEQWLEKTPDGKAKTMPIGRAQWLLTNIFQEWYVEVLKADTMFNSLVCTVRVYYKDPVDGTYHHQDGVGAAPAKTAKGAKASDMTEILNDAVQTGLPAAKSFAIKDACDHIGPMFGRDINRKANYGYQGQYEEAKAESVLEKFAQAETPEDLDNILNSIPLEEQQAYAQVAKNRLEEIRNGSNGV